VTSLAKRLGAPKDFKLTLFQDDLNTDQSALTHWSTNIYEAEFQATPYGFPFRIAPGLIRLNIDRYDGVLCSFVKMLNFPYSIESHEKKLTFKEASKIAEPTVRQYSVGEYSPSSLVPRSNGQPVMSPPKRPAPPSYVGYVCPNGMFGAPKYSQVKTETRKLRLAWVLCYPQYHEIWVDAADGKILGGICTRRN